MSTHRSTWKKREQQAAAIFGARRNVLSGSSGRSDRDTSDSTHERLHIEVKLRESHSIFTLWRLAWIASCREHNKKPPFRSLVCANPPVLMLAEKNHDGFLCCVHNDHIEQLCEEWLVVQDNQTLNDLCERIRLRRIEREASNE